MSDCPTSDLYICIISDTIFPSWFASKLYSHFGKGTKVYFIPYGEQNEIEYRRQLEHARIIIVWLSFTMEISNLCNSKYSQKISEQQAIDEILCISPLKKNEIWRGYLLCPKSLLIKFFDRRDFYVLDKLWCTVAY